MDLFKKTKEKVRLDKYLATQKLGLSRAYIQKLIDQGRILVNDRPAKHSHVLKLDDKVSIDIPPPKKLEITAENIPLDIVYEDKDLLVINKQRGLVVHPAVGNWTGTLVNAILYHVNDLSGIGGVGRPGIVHRLDKETSGLMVVAKSDLAHSSLAKQFKDRQVKKLYVALVHGSIKPDDGFIQTKIGRHPVNRKKFAVIKDANLKSREALTFFKVLKRSKNYSLVELTLKTGRTHQIRVHLSHLGHPLVGDKTYGGRTKIGDLPVSVMLHAETLGFTHPRTNKYMEFKQALPEDMKDAIQNIT